MNPSESENDDVPVGFAPSVADINDEPLLFEGQLSIQSSSLSVVGNCRVFWHWLPRPGLHFVAEFDHPGLHEFFWKRFLKDDEPAVALVMDRQFDFDVTSTVSDTQPLAIEGRLIEQNDDGIQDFAVTRIQSHLTNFVDFFGQRRITNQTRCGSMWGRALAHFDGWEIVLDKVFQTEKERAVARKRGYGVTDTLSVFRADGSEFKYRDAVPVLESLATVLSFARGRWVAPILLFGYDSRGTKRLLKPHFGRLKGHTSPLSWTDNASSDWLQSLVNGLTKRFCQKTWTDPLNHAIFWYVESNSDRSGGMEGAIILLQAALESLAWTYWVADQGVVSIGSFDKKLPASDKIALLLHEAKIPAAIPTELTNLLSVANELGWANGAMALCEIRNKLVHGTMANRNQLKRVSTDAIFECWQLGLHYLELVILWLLEHRGTYLNRNRRVSFRTQAVERVPWAV